MTTKIDSATLQQELAGFTGTDHWYRHAFGSGCTYTDGAQHFAETAGAYWFLDIVFTELVKLQRSEGFLNIVLNVADNTAIIEADDGNDKTLWTRSIDYTDCPPGRWQFYFVDDVFLLPSEY